MIARYLDAGKTLAATGSMTDDYLDAARKDVARLEVATDGRWLWPRDLAYYVREHHVRLPPEFVRHMRDSGWTVPELTDQDLIRLAREVLPGP